MRQNLFVLQAWKGASFRSLHRVCCVARVCPIVNGFLVCGSVAGQGLVWLRLAWTVLQRASACVYVDVKECYLVGLCAAVVVTVAAVVTPPLNPEAFDELRLDRGNVERCGFVIGAPDGEAGVFATKAGVCVTFVE